MGRHGTGGVSALGPPPCPLFPLLPGSACTSQPCSSFWGVAVPPAPLGTPNSRCPGGLQPPQIPKNPGTPLRSPAQPQTRGSGEGKPPWEGNFPLLASRSLRATRGISFRVHLGRIPSFFSPNSHSPNPARGSQVAAPSREPGSFSRHLQGDGDASGACSSSPIFLVGFFLGF